METTEPPEDLDAVADVPVGAVAKVPIVETLAEGLGIVVRPSEFTAGTVGPPDVLHETRRRRIDPRGGDDVVQERRPRHRVRIGVENRG